MLSYIYLQRGVVLRDNYEAFLDEYIYRAPLNDTTFTTAAEEVHTYRVKFILDNDTAE